MELLISGILYSGSVDSDLDDEVEESDDLIETDKKSTGIFKADHLKRYLILETNYRLYAYTDSELQINTLQYFAKILYKLPGMAVLTGAANETKTQKHERNVNEGFQKSPTWNESNVVQNDQNHHFYERRMKIISLFVAIMYYLATFYDTRHV